jgi:hypothetical protein
MGTFKYIKLDVRRTMDLKDLAEITHQFLYVR